MDDTIVRYTAHVRDVANVCVALTEVRAKIAAPLAATWHYAGNTKGSKKNVCAALTYKGHLSLNSE